MNLAGRKLGKVLDTQAMVKDKAKQAKNQVRNTPTNLKYNLHKGIENTKKAPSEFKRGLVQEKANRAESREKQRQRRDTQMAEKRKVLGEAANRQVKKRANVPIKEETKPQNNRLPKNDSSKRTIKVHSNPEIKRRLSNQELIVKENNQPVRKISPIQQAKKRSILAKEGNQKVQKRVNHRPKPRPGEKK